MSSSEAAAGASWISSRGERVLPAVSSARVLAASAGPHGGDIPPKSSSGAAATSAAAATSSRGGGIPAAVPAVATSAAVATSSRGGGIPAAVPAAEVTGSPYVSGSGVGPPAVVGAAPTPPASDSSVGAGVATGEPLAAEQEQEQLVTSGGRREVLAGVSRMAGGTSPVGPSALPAALPAPPGPAGMVHDGDAGERWQGQRVTLAVTKSRARRDGLRPGMFALMATQEDFARSIAELSLPDVVEQELPSELACNLETPETDVQAHAGPHGGIWTEAEGKELRGLNAAGTFKAAGSE